MIGGDEMPAQGQMNGITSLPTDSIRPNQYNPNQMTDDEFAECLAEVRHLGRLPKPIIVRSNGEGFLIVDGEHGWRCAVEAKLDTVACEVVDVDDFEAMRQTYKRNQHGTHNPVKLGQMFRRMMADRDLSQRALAEDIEVSEGTVRNALEYAKASGVRNDYAFDALAIKQVRAYNRLPLAIGNYWVDCGAEIKHLDITGSMRFNNAPSPYEKLADCELLSFAPRPSKYQNFRAVMEKVTRWYYLEGRWARCGLTREDVRPYVQHHFKDLFYVKDEEMMNHAMGAIADIEDKTVRLLLTPEQFEDVIEITKLNPASHNDFMSNLESAVFKASGVRTEKAWTKKTELLEADLADAPDFIKDSKLTVEAKIALRDLAKGQFDGDVAYDRTRRAIASGETLHLESKETWRDAIHRRYRQLYKTVEIEYLAECKTEHQLAFEIAGSVPFYDKEKNSGAIEAMAKVLSQLNKGELLYIRRNVDYGIWNEVMLKLAGVARSTQ